ncbi:MAG: hypothetical protein ACOY4R_27675 [Pseudomonadota bacterium]
MDPQTFLWSIHNTLGPWWYVLWGSMATVAAILIFAVTIIGQPITVMTVARFLFCMALITVPLCLLNSGWQPFAVVLFVLAAFIGAMAMTVERCDRELGHITIGGALVEKAKRFWGALHFWR